MIFAILSHRSARGRAYSGADAQTEKEHQVVAMMQTTVMRMAELIDNVLDFARGRLGGGITLDRNARKPLEPVLHQVIDELRLSSPGRQIEAEYAIDSPGGLRQSPDWAACFQSRRQRPHPWSVKPARARARGDGGRAIQIVRREWRRTHTRGRDGQAVRTVLPRRSARQPAGLGSRICTLPRKSRKLTTAC